MTTDSPRDEAETCGPACSEGHTYALGTCALSCKEIGGGIADMSWTVPCPWCKSMVGFPCYRPDGSAYSGSHGHRWDAYEQAQKAADAPDAPKPGWIARLSTPDDDRSQITETVRGGRRLAPAPDGDGQAAASEADGSGDRELAVPASDEPADFDRRIRFQLVQRGVPEGHADWYLKGFRADVLRETEAAANAGAGSLRERVAAVIGSLHAELWGAPASPDFSPATQAVIGDGLDRTYLDIADAVLAAVQGLYVPPPPGSDRDKLPDWIVPLISAFVRPYTSTGCEAAQAIRRVISGRYSNQTAELAEWEQREHASCRLTRKQDLAKCICPCHQEPTP